MWRLTEMRVKNAGKDSWHDGVDFGQPRGYLRWDIRSRGDVASPVVGCWDDV